MCRVICKEDETHGCRGMDCIICPLAILSGRWEDTFFPCTPENADAPGAKYLAEGLRARKQRT